MTHKIECAEKWNYLVRRAPNGLEHSLRKCPAKGCTFMSAQLQAKTCRQSDDNWSGINGSLGFQPLHLDCRSQLVKCDLCRYVGGDGAILSRPGGKRSKQSFVFL
ncbi:hypothetical protein AVEN_93238-1 [Araneus ventricosus]|uniref:Uncharacterized protein n=1 Tax=Araneus ventricosus TaxID=182803 RepID=A0A4Y2TCQ5_ARAVE|nr:hypothetical protein AVEN_93238-1 [Araneus ventricosus]